MRIGIGAPARFTALAILSSALLALGPPRLSAQYFGQNKVQYENFDFRVMHTDHYDIHYYPAESLATADASRMAERWYDRHSRTFQHTFAKKPIIFYADHPDFEQTNTQGGFISQGIGGFTEPIRNRVVMPFTGVYADNDHVLGHELVHVFQYDIASNSTTGNGLQGMNQLPGWLIEGMAEYLSIGREDPHTAMWLRDAALRNDLPSIKKLSTDPRYFPYRYGEALWAYIGGTWGDGVITALYRTALRGGWEPAVKRILGRSSDSLSKEWLSSIRATYTPLMAGRAAPKDAGTRVLERTEGRLGEMDVSPALSPDGRYVAFITGRALLDVGLMVADATTGRIVKRLTSPNRDPHFAALSFIASAGAWSPDARRLAYPVFDDGDMVIAIFDVNSRRIERKIRVRGVGAISDVSWSADNRIALSGWSGGISDLYVLDVATERVQRLTNDRYADLQPTWSPDGRTIAFVTDRAPSTNFDQLTYGPMQIGLMDVASGRIEVLSLFKNAKHINPQYTPDGRSLYFISDRDGFSDIYRVALGSGDGAPGAITQSQISQVTHLATGVSGITYLSPALSVARQSGRLVFSVFEHAGNSLYRMEADQAAGTPVEATTAAASVAGVLPPVEALSRSLVTAYLHDPQPIAPPGQPDRITSYKPSLSLEYLGAPSVGVGTSTFGTVVGGSVAAYFTDLLTNRVVGAALQASGTVKDIGGQLFYLNQRRRWNWQVGGAHVPYLTGFAQVRDTSVQGEPVLVYEQILQRIYFDQAAASVQYPFSQTHRIELGGGYTHIGYGTEVQRIYSDQFGNVLGQGKQGLPSPPGFGYVQATAAFVGDYSYFGFTSPVAGGRYRFEAGPSLGTINFQTVLADYRRYFFLRPVTFAFRGLHYGRYGAGGESRQLQPLFLGEETLVRGYSFGSFDVRECGNSAEGSCPPFDRLIGSRIGVANAEIRIPLFGTEQFGLINFPYLPTEVAPFIDAGVAWTSTESPKLEWSRQSRARVPVVSAGVSVRVNLLGYAVGEVYYAYPFQRPGKGAHFGIQLQPGW